MMEEFAWSQTAEVHSLFSVSAQGYEYDNLYVHFFLELPNREYSHSHPHHSSLRNETALAGPSDQLCWESTKSNVVAEV